MKIAILTFDGFNEIDSFVAYSILNRMKKQHWRAYITSPNATVTSLNGITVTAERSLAFAQEADAVLVGSGTESLAISKNQAILQQLSLNPDKQLIGSQCSGALVLAGLGLLAGIPACVDSTTRITAENAGIRVLEQPFYAKDTIASAGGCLASTYLAAWVLHKLGGSEAARYCIDYVAPIEEKERFVAHALSVVEPFIDSKVQLDGTY